MKKETVTIKTCVSFIFITSNVSGYNVHYYYRKEEKTQGNPRAMRAYVLGILPLIKFLLEFVNEY